MSSTEDLIHEYFDNLSTDQTFYLNFDEILISRILICKLKQYSNFEQKNYVTEIVSYGHGIQFIETMMKVYMTTELRDWTNEPLSQVSDNGRHFEPRVFQQWSLDLFDQCVGGLTQDGEHNNIFKLISIFNDVGIGYIEPYFFQSFINLVVKMKEITEVDRALQDSQHKLNVRLVDAIRVRILVEEARGRAERSQSKSEEKVNFRI